MIGVCLPVRKVFMEFLVGGEEVCRLNSSIVI